MRRDCLSGRYEEEVKREENRGGWSKWGETCPSLVMSGT